MKHRINQIKIKLLLIFFISLFMISCPKEDTSKSESTSGKKYKKDDSDDNLPLAYPENETSKADSTSNQKDNLKNEPPAYPKDETLEDLALKKAIEDLKGEVEEVPIMGQL